MAERRPEVRSIEPPGLLSKLWGKTLNAFGVSNDFQEDSASWKDAVRNSANYISPYNVGHGGDLEPQVPQAATDFVDANKGMMERMGRSEPEPLDGLMAFGLSSGVGGLGRRVENYLDKRAARNANANANADVSLDPIEVVQSRPSMAFANADEKAGAFTAAASNLPMDQASRLARAREMNFPDKDWYHSTDTAFDAFDPARIGQNHGDYSNGFHLSDNPETAEMNGGSAIMPLKARMTNPLVVDYPDTGPVQAHDMDRTHLFIKAKQGGHDGILIRGKGGEEHYVAFDPKDLRSKFAAFDPSKSDSADLLAANADEKAAAFAAAAGEPKGITAYHGSPHDFDKFSLNKIGTGEGAQAYGHGLYFADSEGVAKSYRDNLKAKRPVSHSGVIEENGQFLAWAKHVDNDAVEVVHTAPTKAAAQKHLREYMADKRGRMYQVRINAEPESFLDWDKPFREQTPVVQDKVEAALRKAQSGKVKWTPEDEALLAELGPISEAELAYDPFAKLKGSNLLASLERETSRPNASEALKELGIPGIRYLDGQSRADGAGSSNYVVFDDSLIEILKKYGMAGGALGAGAMLQSGDAGATPFGASSQTLIPPLMEQSLGAFGQPDDDQN